MNKKIATAAIIALVSCAALTSLGKLPPENAIKLEKTQAPAELKSGQLLPIVIPGNTTANAKIGGYQVFCYVDKVPPACKSLDWKMKKAAKDQWNTYQIQPHQWLKSGCSGNNFQFNCELDTTKWPEGDYNLTILLTVLVDGKDYYLPVEILFCITK